MDSFGFDFDTDSTLTNDTTSTNGDFDWFRFESSTATISNSPFSSNWPSQQDDAVAPENRTSFIANGNGNENEIFFQIEHFFNGFNQQQNLSNGSISIVEQEQTQLQPIQINLQTNSVEMNDFDLSQRIRQQSPLRQDRTNNFLPAPLVPRVSSSRSQCYHKLPDHAVKLMQEWYNANINDPYPRSPDKKRFISEGNITAQQCRSWFANRRQRLKHVKRNHPRASSSNSFSPSPTSSSSSSSRSLNTTNQTRLTTSSSSSASPTSTTTTTTTTIATRPNNNVEEQNKSHEHCYYCQQTSQSIASPSLPLSFTSNSTLSPPSSPAATPTATTTTTTTTLNVVINQQTIEQLIHNSLRKLLYPTVM